MISDKDVRGIINCYANKFIIKFPPNSIYDKDDLLSEGYVIYYNVSEKFDKSKQVSFTTFFITCLIRRYVKLLNNAYKKQTTPIESDWEPIEEEELMDKVLSNDTEIVFDYINSGQMPEIRGCKKRREFIREKLEMNSLKFQKVCNEIKKVFG